MYVLQHTAAVSCVAGVYRLGGVKMETYTNVEHAVSEWGILTEPGSLQEDIGCSVKTLIKKLSLKLLFNFINRYSPNSKKLGNTLNGK